MPLEGRREGGKEIEGKTRRKRNEDRGMGGGVGGRGRREKAEKGEEKREGEIGDEEKKVRVRKEGGKEMRKGRRKEG